MRSTYEIEIGYGKILFEVGKLAQQSNGAVVLYSGETILLATACASKEPKVGANFMPLTVEVAEKFYAAGRLPGGFFKREGRPSTEAILAARLCDRPHRPLFPPGYCNDTQIIVTLLSADKINPYRSLAITAASAALAISDIPFDDPVGACVIGLIDGDFVVNPTYQDLQRSQIELTVAGTADAIMMVEADARMVSEDILVEALELAQEVNARIVLKIREMQAAVGKKKWPAPSESPDAKKIEEAVRSRIGDSIAEALRSPGSKQSRNDALEKIMKETREIFAEDSDEGLLKDALHKIEKEEIRSAILNHQIRPDGRRMDEIRHLESEVGLLPRVHGSALFTRGETQILNAVTLASSKENQRIDGFGLENEKFFIHHYNFPPYSTGEAGRFGFTGRREIGHGALAERALMPVIPSQEDFPYTIRSVSEALSSNGSTSMASVCSGSLALMDAGIPISDPVAGIAMGLVIGEDGRYEILTDIQGAEDHSGDMDFKVAGTKKGVTALQMDIKIKGVSMEIIRDALGKAHKARLEILDHMSLTLEQPREHMSKYAPKMYTLNIPTDKIGALIGSGGSVIRGLIDEYSVTIDVDDAGVVIIGSSDGEAAKKAEAAINVLVRDVEAGQVYRGKVVRIMHYGAFVQLAPGKDGLLHISEISNERIPNVESVLNIGDEVEVIVTEVDGMGRINLSARVNEKGERDDSYYTSSPSSSDSTRQPPHRRNAFPRDGDSRQRDGDSRQRDGDSRQNRRRDGGRDGGDSNTRRRPIRGTGKEGRRPSPPKW